MRKQSRKKRDVNEMAFSMVQAIAAGEPIPKTEDGKNPLAVALGRMGGLKGGHARAAGMTAKQRSESAKKAAQARWSIKEK
jgi:nanoRNase/pAp phosphatase (c-di-AMP/oligoRNAs hydrolase)